MKILIPGGHLTPALGLIDWIKQKHPKDEIVFIGRTYSQDRLKQRAVEAYEVTKREIKFIPFSAVKFGKENIFSMIVKFFKFGRSLVQSCRLLNQEKPTVLMSFGGYVALPLTIVASMKRIPIVTHEGTRVVGLANQLIFKLARKIAHAYPRLVNIDQAQFSSKMVLTGTPIRASILKTTLIKPEWLKFNQDKPILMILGGNQGSRALNDFVADNLKALTKKFVVVHQCGRPNSLANYPQQLNVISKNLKINPNDYYVLPWIDELDLVWLYKYAAMALTRSGANTLEELIYHQLPSILVPLPHSHFDEQRLNAQHVQALGGAMVLEQSELTWANFSDQVSQILKNRNKIQQSLVQLKNNQIQDSAEKIYALLVETS